MAGLTCSSSEVGTSSSKGFVPALVCLVIIVRLTIGLSFRLRVGWGLLPLDGGIDNEREWNVWGGSQGMPMYALARRWCVQCEKRDAEET